MAAAAFPPPVPDASPDPAETYSEALSRIADLQARYRLSYLFITHDLQVVRAITDRVLVMQAGEIVEEGETGRVLDAPEHPYTKALIAAAPAIPADWRQHG